jgi:hypothetical protein
VPVPGLVAADLVVVESGFILRLLEALLDSPSTARDADQFGKRRVAVRVTYVVCDVVWFGDASAGE